MLGGFDVDGNGVLDEAEATGPSQTGCSGASSLTRTIVLASDSAAGDATCPESGTNVQTGLDRNANGTLEDSEVTSKPACLQPVPLLFGAAVVLPGSAADAGATTVRWRALAPRPR